MSYLERFDLGGLDLGGLDLGDGLVFWKQKPGLP